MRPIDLRGERVNPSRSPLSFALEGKPMTVVIHVEGGIVQSVQADGSDDVQAIVYDADSEETTENPVMWFPVEAIEPQRLAELADCANEDAWTVA